MPVHDLACHLLPSGWSWPAGWPRRLVESWIPTVGGRLRHPPDMQWKAHIHPRDQPCSKDRTQFSGGSWHCIKLYCCRGGNWLGLGLLGIFWALVARDHDITMAHCEQRGAWINHMAPLLSMEAKGCNGRASQDICCRALARLPRSVPKGNGPARNYCLGPADKYT